MDIVLNILDDYVFDHVYDRVAIPHQRNVTGVMKTTYETLPRDDIYRQFISFFFVGLIMGGGLYFLVSGLSYVFIFDKETMKHPKYLKNQIRKEIITSLKAIPGIAILTAPWFVGEVRGYSKLYDRPDEYGWPYFFLQFPIFLLFTDICIYGVHRWLHTPAVYKVLHKPHHKWIMPTPFASFAFHPLDATAQSIPYHAFVFLFPLNKYAYLALFTFIQIWTVLIHDGEYMAQGPIVNGAACHTIHHLYFNYNYGQFTTIFDRMFGTYREPDIELFDKEKKQSKETWAKELKEVERMQREVEPEEFAKNK